VEQVLLEVCVESARAAALAEAGGADRIELCRDLAAEGLTPGTELVRETRDACRLPVFGMVRPRPGDFRADEGELARMEREVDRLVGEGLDGLVLGLLDRKGRIDAPSIERLVTRAGPLPVTFHRAFDRVPDPRAALETLVGLGVARVLTSGRAPTALEGVELLAELVERAGGRIVVMPGGNVRAGNAAELVGRTGARELHSSVGGEAGISADGVRALKAAGSLQAG
jgi:copper homeostasis protein